MSTQNKNQNNPQNTQSQTSTSNKQGNASAYESFQAGRRAGNIIDKIATIGLAAILGVELSNE